ncbi:TPA: hypothetical protein VCA72_002133 [Streptococcus suis]|nr:hypothetical protein [Streptococcus suis]HEM6220006.1 hypothetical protein [Streptococcus suis]HEP1844958.1 hypothetical protein [Streptococcus suis]
MNKTFFSSLDELKEGFDCNMEYDIKLVGCEYYIVFFGEERVISELFGVNAIIVKDFDDLLDADLHGTTLRQSWDRVTA